MCSVFLCRERKGGGGWRGVAGRGVAAAESSNTPHDACTGMFSLNLYLVQVHTALGLAVHSTHGSADTALCGYTLRSICFGRPCPDG